MITTSNIEVHSTERELQDLGFKGKCLQDLSTLITTQEGIAELESFILDTEGQYKCSVSIASGYRRLKMLESTMDEISFVYGYPQSDKIEDMILHLQNLLKCYVSLEDVVRYNSGLKEGRFDRLSFYYAFISEPLLSVKRLCTEAEMQFNEIGDLPEPTDW